MAGPGGGLRAGRTHWGLRRLGLAALLVYLVLTLTFFAIEAAPGGPAALTRDPRIPRAEARRLETLYGLDRPLPERYLRWLGAVALHGDLGFSFSFRRPVAGVVAERLPATLLLSTAALLIQYAIALGLAAAAAGRPRSGRDRAARWLSLAAYSLPGFWLGLAALFLFAHAIPLFPPGQMHSPDAFSLTLLYRWLDLLRHLALPALVLGCGSAGAVMRFARNQLVDVLGEEYIRAGRARGLTERRLLWLHALRNAAGPLTQLAGLSLPFLLSGALITEVVFSWPGVGRLAHRAFEARDYPLLLACTALTATMTVVGSLLADLLHRWVDPRVRHV